MTEEPPPEPEPATITLDPILTDGQAALSTHDLPGIADAKLRRLDVAWDNTSQEVTTLKADDLLSEGPSDRIPKRGALLRALSRSILPSLAEARQAPHNSPRHHPMRGCH